MIPVTKPFLPPQNEYNKFLKGIWERNFLTNDGPLVKELEQKLKSKLGINNLLFVSNGTIALQIAIKALELNGEIITTPFSYVATSSSIVWENCKPVFADIDDGSLNIDSSKIESLITNKTVGILATHCFGNTCEIDDLKTIGDKYNLKIIYDAAHCFGVKYKGKSVLEYGDISTCSFHATKLFHTVEGGAIVANNEELIVKMSFMRNFGHNGPERFSELGINGKNSEFHAAMGLCNLEYIDQILEVRKKQFLAYNKLLADLSARIPKIDKNCSYNYSYYPIILDNEDTLLKVVGELNKNNIFPRRYFYPPLSSLPYVEKGIDLPVANDISSRVICLPLYHEMKEQDQENIARILLGCQA